jgi:predicted HAD superfamily Cof-like phosphohydrolase
MVTIFLMVATGGLYNLYFGLLNYEKPTIKWVFCCLVNKILLFVLSLSYNRKNCKDYMSQFGKVKKFHEVYKCNIGIETNFPTQDERNLRMELLKEEYNEYLTAESKNDLVEVADALGDMLYIIYGTCISYGIPIDDVFNEIHNSNMSKLDSNGNPIFREDGKVLKGPNYFKPNIAKIIFKGDQ